MINFISNLPANARTGGFTARNAGALTALSRVDAVHYAGPINPPPFMDEKIASKLLRVLGRRGDFFFFSRRRLKRIARQAEAACRPQARLDFFNGFTPWVLTRPARPYIAWSDCTFRDYVNIFHRREDFRKADLERIERAEAAWLKGARRVILRSRWAAEQTAAEYGLDPARLRSVSNFGAIEMPAEDAYRDGQTFLFVSTNFVAKGGYEVLAAFREVRKDHPGARLIIVGEAPGERTAQENVEITGYLRKEVAEEAQRLRSLFAGARALVHPTKSDTNPAILVEAGYFGCPVIASRRFAIPETVEDGRTGFLLDAPTSAQALAGAMRWMLEQDEPYRAMRQAAWRKTRRDHSRTRFEESLIACVEEVLAETPAGPAQ